ncbi:hypothetical protein SCUP515_10415 [Seiridium cupressi]
MIDRICPTVSLILQSIGPAQQDPRRPTRQTEASRNSTLYAKSRVSTGHPSEESNVFGPSQSQQHPCIENDGTPQRYLALPWLCTPQKDQAEADVRPEHSSSGQVVAVRYGLRYGTVGDTGAGWTE